MGTTAEQPEARLRELMMQGLAGDSAAQRRLLQELSLLLRAFHRRRLGQTSADVEDLVQETLIAVHTRRSTYDPDRPFTAWVYAIARYKLVDYLRRAQLRAAAPLDEHLELFCDESAEQGIHERDIERLLAELPSKQREALRLTRIEGFSVEEAATKSGQSVSAIKVGVHRGLKRLLSLTGRDR